MRHPSSLQLQSRNLRPQEALAWRVFRLSLFACCCFLGDPNLSWLYLSFPANPGGTHVCKTRRNHSLEFNAYQHQNPKIISKPYGRHKKIFRFWFLIGMSFVLSACQIRSISTSCARRRRLGRRSRPGQRDTNFPTVKNRC